MHTYQILLIFLILPFIMAEKGYAEKDDGVLVLNATNFELAITFNEYIMVEFYTPQCGHCKRFAPTYSHTAQLIKDQKINAVLAKVDCEDPGNKELLHTFKVNSFPTLIFFIKGQPVPYGHERDSDTIIKFILKKQQPASRWVMTREEVEQAEKESRIVVMFWGGEIDKKFPIFEDVSKNFDFIQFLHSESSKLKNEYKVPSNASLSLFRKFDNPQEDYSGEFEYEKIIKFIQVNEIPGVAAFEGVFAQRTFLEYLPAIILFMGDNMESDWAMEALHEVKSRLKGKINLGYATLEGEYGEKLGSWFEIDKKELPTLRLVHPIQDERPKKYARKTHITADNVYKFYEDWNKGLLKVMPLEQAPFEQEFEPYRILTGKNFVDVTTDPYKDVLVEFNALACDDCHPVTAMVEQVAHMVLPVHNLLICRIDVITNDVEGIDKAHLPAIRFYPRNNKTPILYDGEYKHKDLVDWMRKHSTVSWDNFA